MGITGSERNKVNEMTRLAVGFRRFAVSCATLCVGNDRTSDAQPVIDGAQNGARAAGVSRGKARWRCLSIRR
jgi:hypothetical protein